MQAVQDSYHPQSNHLSYCQYSNHMTKAFDDNELQKLLRNNMYTNNPNIMEKNNKMDCMSVSTRTSSMDKNDMIFQFEDSNSEDSSNDDQ